jgi:hypothetical protein
MCSTAKTRAISVQERPPDRSIPAGPRLALCLGSLFSLTNTVYYRRSDR